MLEFQENNLTRQIRLYCNLLMQKIFELLVHYQNHTKLYDQNQQTCQTLKNLAEQLAGNAESSASTEGQEEAQPPSPRPGF